MIIKTILLLHILGVLGLFAAMAVQFFCYSALRRAENTIQARGIFAILCKLPAMFGTSSALIFLSGLYLSYMRYAHHETIGWVVVAVITFIATGGISSHTGKKFSEQLISKLPQDSDQPLPLSEDFKKFARRPKQMRAISCSFFSALGVLILMVFRPDVLASIIVIVISFLIGYFIFGTLRFLVKAHSLPINQRK
ncbi:MAG TPA: hypothetical protein VFM02_04400 [Candidatus Paceibacterota bacterium]|nr:hypothetical protein [Candidatus Paceibacterota bacterium]